MERIRTGLDQGGEGSIACSAASDCRFDLRWKADFCRLARKNFAAA